MSQTSVAVGNRRLLKLADFLEQLPRNRFDYGEWAGDDWKGKPDLSCGTTACALGWATAMPEFRRLGLVLHRPKFRYHNGGVVEGGPRVTLKEFLAEDPMEGKSPEGDHPSAIAAAKIFGLSLHEATGLFTPRTSIYINDKVLDAPDVDATPRLVAKHIRRFVRERERVLAKVAA